MNTKCMLQAEQLIQQLQLQKHPLEGGYFRRTYQSPHIYHADDSKNQRYCATAIYYLLTKDEPVGFLHRNRSDILHCYHLGDPAEYILIKEDGSVTRQILGPDIRAGQCLQLLVEGGVWKASRLLGHDYSLISEVVVPGFDYADNELARRGAIAVEQLPQLEDLIQPE